MIKMMFITMLNHYGYATREEHEVVCRADQKPNTAWVSSVCTDDLVLQGGRVVASATHCAFADRSTGSTPGLVGILKLLLPEFPPVLTRL